MESTAPSTSEGGFLSRMALNDNKAGMGGLDRDKINKIIMDSSKGSMFYKNELKKEQQVNQRIEKMMLQKAQITEQQLKKAQNQVESIASELERSRDLSRIIVHVDMDAFYAAVEMRDCPELKDKPMAVGSMSMLSTSNYHARKFGVRAAMPGFIAKKLCSNLVIVPTNFHKYRAVSDEIREIFSDYDPNFQPLSLDEAYLDFTDHLEQRKNWPESLRTHRFHSTTAGTAEVQNIVPEETVAGVEDLSPVLFDDSPSISPCLPASGETAEPGVSFEVFGTSVEEAVREMRFRIEQKTALTASAGIAPNMMLAKVCSDKNKPNGQYRLPSNKHAVMDFIHSLPVRKVFGIGKVSEKMLGALGVSSCAHLGQQMALLSLLFSETAWHHFMRISMGLGSTHIERNGERKSMSTERTFREMSTAEEQLSLCRELCEDLAEDMKKERLRAKTVTLKLKNVNFEVKTRAWTLPSAVATAEEVFSVAKDLLKTEIEHVDPQPLRLRLMGVRISAFVSAADKKSLQKSIVGFFQQSKTDLGAPSQDFSQKPERDVVSNHTVQIQPPAGILSAQQLPQEGQRKEAIPWKAAQVEREVGNVGDEQPKSFFQRVRARRLHLQVETPNIRVEGRGHDSTEFTHPGTDDEKCVDSPTKMDESEGNSPASVVSNLANVSLSPAEARASTSGWATKKSECLTCPVCFRDVETTDLNVFNRHIDQCLSGVPTKPPQNTDSESDQELDNGHREGVSTEGGSKERFKENEMEKATPDEDLDDFKMSNHSKRLVFPATSHRQPEDNSGRGRFKRSRTCLSDHHRGESDQSDSLKVDSPVDDGGPGAGQAPPESHGSALICPVCQVAQETDDLTLFNHHVDLCLNQEVLDKLRGRASSSVNQLSSKAPRSKVKERDQHFPRPAKKGKSKRQSASCSPPSKKTKGPAPQSTLDKFFR